MPWQAAHMGNRVAALALLVALLSALAACTDDEPGPGPAAGKTSDTDCATRIPDHVFTTLGWKPTGKPAESTVRGCHREAEQGYVEVRDRTGYDKLCKTLDRKGGVSPGRPVDWLGGTVTACAVEPAKHVGQTKVVVRKGGDDATQITIAVLTDTPQARVRAAVAELLP
jgi:hypothetical protein